MTQTCTMSCRIPLSVKRTLDEYLDRHHGLSKQQVLKAALLRYLDAASALTWEIPERCPEKGEETRFIGTFTSVDGDPQGFLAFLRGEDGNKHLVNWRQTEVLE